MITKMVSGGLKAVVCGLAATGFAALVLAGLVAWPVQQPPELTSISGARKSVDLSSLPAIERFQARDGTALGFRHYPATGSATGRAVILIHGSSGSSGTTIHALSGALAAHGVETYTVDIRGHGASGTRGDVAYVGQLEDDFADFVAVVRKTTIIAGADDELMLADKYVEAVRGMAVPVNVKLIDGVNHMGIVSAPAAISVIADDVATRGLSS